MCLRCTHTYSKTENECTTCGAPAPDSELFKCMVNGKETYVPLPNNTRKYTESDIHEVFLSNITGGVYGDDTPLPYRCPLHSAVNCDICTKRPLSIHDETIDWKTAGTLIFK